MGKENEIMWPSFEEVHRAATMCMKRKKSRLDAIAFRRRYGEEIFNLATRIRTKTYNPQAGLVFVADFPKYREIHAAHFRDRVVHHLLYNHLEPIFEELFIEDSYACRKGKGTHAAAKNLAKKMRCITRNGKIKAYGLKMDIKSFFPSIHKATLLELLKPKCKQLEHGADVYKLAEVIVNHDPVKCARPRGNRQDFNKVPKHKRLGALGPEYGLPIGNLTSQFFGNVYLNALDQFVKRTLGVRYYLRYVDDFIILNEDPTQLRVWEQRIREFLNKKLLLKAHENTKITLVSKGIDFVGYMIRPDYVLTRNRVIKHADKRITELETQLQPKQIGSIKYWPIDSDAIEKLRAAWASYYGHFRHAASYCVRKRLWRKHLISRFYLTPSLKRRFSLFKLDSSWKYQVKRLSQGIRKAVLIVKVGQYAETPLRRDIKRLGLKAPKSKQRGRLRAGVPYKSVYSLINRCLERGISVALAKELNETTGQIKARKLEWFIEKTSKNA